MNLENLKFLRQFGGEGGFINPQMLENKVYRKQLLKNRKFNLNDPTDKKLFDDLSNWVNKNLSGWSIAISENQNKGKVYFISPNNESQWEEPEILKKENKIEELEKELKNCQEKFTSLNDKLVNFKMELEKLLTLI